MCFAQLGEILADGTMDLPSTTAMSSEPAASNLISERAATANPACCFDRRTPRRYNRRDTPARLYRPPHMRDRMRSMTSPSAPERRAAGSDAETRVQAPSRPRSESRQRTALVAVRLLPQERDVLAETARSRGITLSELIRASAMRAASAPADDGEARLPAHSAVPKADRLRELRPRADAARTRTLYRQVGEVFVVVAARTKAPSGSRGFAGPVRRALQRLAEVEEADAQSVRTADRGVGSQSPEGQPF